jgi:predicted CXXCH cytochrome family protein
VNVLIRYLRQGPDGTPEAQDVEAAVDVIDIGSAADSTIQLLGRDIAAEHAYLTVSADQVKLIARKRARVRINDREVAAASLAIGDRIEIGGHHLRLVAPPPGFEAAVEVQLNPAADASEFESAFRTHIDQTWLSRRGGAWLLGTLTLLVGLAIPLAMVFVHRQGVATPRGVPDDTLWSAGALLPAHQLAVSDPASPAHPKIAGQRCSACHQQLFVPVRDAACRTCHERVIDHVPAQDLARTQLAAPQRCAQCHREHDGETTLLAVKDDSLCVTCHSASHARFGSLKIEPVSGFGPGAGHPKFSVTLLKPPGADSAGAGRGPARGDAAPTLCEESSDNALRNALADWVTVREPLATAHEQSNLKFSHAQHLDPRHVTRTSNGGALGCVDCHLPESDGEHFAPVTMARTCGSGGCHQLTFDRHAPELPHARPCDAMLVIEDYFARKLTDPTLADSRRMPARRLPDRAAEATTAAESCKDATYVCATKRANAEIERQFSPSGSGCVSCHVVSDNHAGDIHERFQVVPVRLATDYFAKARFNHQAHAMMNELTGDAACETCHRAHDSTQSSDVMIPDIGKCVECHSDRPTSEQIGARCVSCHAYHPRTPITARREGAG